MTDANNDMAALLTRAIRAGLTDDDRRQIVDYAIAQGSGVDYMRNPVLANGFRNALAQATKDVMTEFLVNDQMFRMRILEWVRTGAARAALTDNDLSYAIAAAIAEYMGSLVGDDD